MIVAQPLLPSIVQKIINSRKLTFNCQSRKEAIMNFM